jgi:hypothetical protein
MKSTERATYFSFEKDFEQSKNLLSSVALAHTKSLPK